MPEGLNLWLHCSFMAISRILPIHIPPIPDAHHHNQQHVILHFINNAVLPHAKSIPLVLTFHFDNPARPGVVSQILKPGKNTHLNRSAQFAKIALCAPTDPDGIGHLHAQFFFECFQRLGLSTILFHFCPCSVDGMPVNYIFEQLE